MSLQPMTPLMTVGMILFMVVFMILLMFAIHVMRTKSSKTAWKVFSCAIQHTINPQLGHQDASSNRHPHYHSWANDVTHSSRA